MQSNTIPKALLLSDMGIDSSYLEALVLKNTLDGGVFSAWRQFGLEDDAKGAIADNLALRILHLFRLASETVLDLFANDFCMARQ